MIKEPGYGRMAEYHNSRDFSARGGKAHAEAGQYFEAASDARSEGDESRASEMAAIAWRASERALKEDPDEELRELHRMREGFKGASSKARKLKSLVEHGTQEGPRGGQFYTTSTGQRVYVKRG